MHKMPFIVVKFCFCPLATTYIDLVGSSGHFNLCDLTEGQSLFQILPISGSYSDDHDVFSETESTMVGQSSARHSTVLHHGIQFQTGRLVWALTALPQDQVLTIKMFSAAREGCLDDLRAIIDQSQCTDCLTPHVFVTPPSVSQHHESQYKFSTVSIVTEAGV